MLYRIVRPCRRRLILYDDLSAPVVVIIRCRRVWSRRWVSGQNGPSTKRPRAIQKKLNQLL